ADLAARDYRAPLVVDDVHRHPERGAAERAGLDRDRRSGREEAGADLGAPGAVDDRTAAASDALEEPAVRLRIPGLAGCHEDPERREVGLRVARGDQRADQRRRAAEDGHALLLDEPPEPVGR